MLSRREERTRADEISYLRYEAAIREAGGGWRKREKTGSKSRGADEGEETRGKESLANGDGDGNAVSVMVDGRRASLRAFRYHFLTVLLGEHVAGINELTISGRLLRPPRLFLPICRPLARTHRPGVAKVCRPFRPTQGKRRL